MNYLAHLLLSHGHNELAFGNFMTDMVTVSEIRAWPDFLKKGVDLHHEIDDMTDQHPENKRLKNILRPHFHKYAGVALDMYYDYVLFQHWDNWAEKTFPDFRKEQYRMIRSFHSYIPERLHPRISHMLAGDFLKSYTTMEGQRFAFQKMNERSRFETGFKEAVNLLPELLGDLNEGFEAFFPDIFEWTRKESETLSKEIPG